MRLVTYNIWGTNVPADYWAGRATVRGALPGSPALMLTDRAAVWQRRRTLLLAELAPIAPDVVALQEAAPAPDAEPAEAGTTQAHQIAASLGLSHVVTGPGGLALLSRFPLHGVAELPLFAARHGKGGVAFVQRAVVATPGEDVVMLVVHWPVGPAAVKLACAEEVLRLVAAEKEGHLVVCGDFNADLGTAPIQRMSGSGLRDAWHAGGGNVGMLTQPLPEPVMRLDHVFVSSGLTVRAAPRLLGASPATDGLFPSDHCGISLTVSSPALSLE